MSDPSKPGKGREALRLYGLWLEADHNKTVARKVYDERRREADKTAAALRDHIGADTDFRPADLALTAVGKTNPQSLDDVVAGLKSFDDMARAIARGEFLGDEG